MRNRDSDPNLSVDSFHNASLESSILSVIEEDDMQSEKMTRMKFEYFRNPSLESIERPSEKPFPLLKQRSLPTHNVVASLASPRKNSFRQMENSQYHPLFGVKQVPNSNLPFRSDLSPRDSDMHDEWIDHFGMEMDSSYEHTDETSSFTSKGTDTTPYKDMTRRQVYTGTKQTPPSNGGHKTASYQQGLTKPNVNNNSKFAPSQSSNNNGHTKHCSRTIAIQNFNSYPFDVLSLFNEYEVRSHKQINSTMLISFFDIRESQRVMQNLNGKTVGNTTLELNYYLLREFSNPDEYNQGTLVIFNLDMTISNAQLIQLFGAYGEIKEIRESPNKKHKFIEFFDVRKAEEAMKHLNKTEVYGRKIKIEPSRPGGANKQDSFRERKNSYTFYNKVSTSAPSYSLLKVDRFSHVESTKRSSRQELTEYGRGD